MVLSHIDQQPSNLCFRRSIEHDPLFGPNVPSRAYMLNLDAAPTRASSFIPSRCDLL
jgi:hypothetical protein